MYEMPVTCRIPAPLESEVEIYTEKKQMLVKGLQVSGEDLGTGPVLQPLG